MAIRRKTIQRKIEERIKTSAEREEYARTKIRFELIEKATKGDVEGMRDILQIISDEAIKNNCKPRATVEVRNELGQSLLSIATQYDHEDLVYFLLNHWKEIEKNKSDLFGSPLVGEEFSHTTITTETRIYKANPNSRDIKGWSCCCIAVFNDSKKSLKLLLQNGGDPNIRSSYNKNAWDLAKDELDSALHIVTSRAEIRQVLIDNDNSKVDIFGTRSMVNTSGCDICKQDNLDKELLLVNQEVGKEGTAMLMNIEMNNEMIASNSNHTDKKKNGTSKGNKAKKDKKEGGTTNNNNNSGKKK